MKVGASGDGSAVGLKMDAAEVFALEERALCGWPALQTELVGGWALRTADGCTKRANSANALAPSAPFDVVRRAAEALYARQGLPPIFRISPLAPGDCDAILDACGYTLLDPSLVMVADVEDQSPPVAVQLDRTPSPDWLTGIATVNGLDPALRPAHDAIVRSIRQPAAFATLCEDGSPLGYGLAVCERGVVGLFDIVVAPAARGRGLGRALTQALLAWGRAAGAHAAYLQVTRANTAAQDLYTSLGFTEAYRYHYRARPT